MSVGQIAEGFINNLTNREQSLYEKRIKICKGCKLLKIDSIFGEVCNSKLYLNPITDNISRIPKEGYKNGCGCFLKAKARVQHASCPLNKW